MKSGNFKSKSMTFASASEESRSASWKTRSRQTRNREDGLNMVLVLADRTFLVFVVVVFVVQFAAQCNLLLALANSLGNELVAVVAVAVVSI